MVSTTPAIKTKLRISLQIFVQIRNDYEGMLRGPGETDLCKKNLKSKILCVRILLNFIYFVFSPYSINNHRNQADTGVILVHVQLYIVHIVHILPEPVFVKV
jgi:hypothetical protein